MHCGWRVSTCTEYVIKEGVYWEQIIGSIDSIRNCTAVWPYRFANLSGGYPELRYLWVCALLHGATGSLQSFEEAFQKYVFLISGYDDDASELYQIPEVVSFIKDLNSKLPFWLYFVNTSDKKFFSWMIACLCRAMSLDQDEETIYADFNADV